jgi:NAD(P)-dependent dehydrogenase (short-subunit alcohol dehydrogenase family)
VTGPGASQYLHSRYSERSKVAPTTEQPASQRLAGKVAVVTGGASGIGLAIVERLVAEGAQVAIWDISDPSQLVQRLGAATLGLLVDISDEQQVTEALSTTASHFGGIDILVNNAGVDGAMAPIAESPLDAFDALMAVNLRGVFIMTKHAVPYLLKSEAPSVVNISSGTALKATPGLAPYSASKAAIITMTKVGAVEYASAGLRMNVILPGAIETPLANALFEQNPEFKQAIVAQHPVGYLGQPSDVAAAVAFLASDDARFITGSELAVDGGYTAI